jgi:hypothetical protein
MLESDWKQLRRIIPEARDRYLKSKNEGIVRLLTSTTATETDKFWQAMESMGKERKILDECLGDMRRSHLNMIILMMYRNGMLIKTDLDHFSENLKQYVLETVETVPGEKHHT